MDSLVPFIAACAKSILKLQIIFSLNVISPDRFGRWSFKVLLAHFPPSLKQQLYMQHGMIHDLQKNIQQSCTLIGILFSNLPGGQYGLLETIVFSKINTLVFRSWSININSCLLKSVVCYRLLSFWGRELDLLILV